MRFENNVELGPLYSEETNMDKHLKTGGKKTSDSASIALPGQKLATSKKPRMLTPSEIVLLKQDLKMALAHSSSR